MASEIFAEDIEAYLEQLEGVERARVEATDDGEVSRVYLIAGTGLDDTHVRRAVETALVTRYNLPVDARRIHIAHLVDDEQRDLPRAVRVYRVEEVLTAAHASVTVELRCERRGREQAVTGRAQLPPGQANRLRAVAMAAADAARAASLFPARPSIESVEVHGAGSREIALVTVTFMEPGLRPAVGAALVAGGEAEAIIAAVLDAAGVRAPGQAEEGESVKDRMDRLEELRSRYQRVLRSPGSQPALPAEDADHAGEALHDIREIRPEAAQPAPPAARDAGRGSARGAPRAAEETFYQRLVEARQPVHIRCSDGYELRRAVLREYGTYVLLVEHDGGDELVYKHAILSIRPEPGE